MGRSIRGWGVFVGGGCSKGQLEEALKACLRDQLLLGEARMRVQQFCTSMVRLWGTAVCQFLTTTTPHPCPHAHPSPTPHSPMRQVTRPQLLEVGEGEFLEWCGLVVSREVWRKKEIRANTRHVYQQHK